MQHAMASSADLQHANAYVRGAKAAPERLPFTCSWNELLELDADRPGQRCALHVTAARNPSQHERTSDLIRKMYSGRGYETDFLSRARSAQQQTFIAAAAHADCLGTVTVVQDSVQGLQVDALFPADVDAVRAEGRRICEFSRLAVEQFDDSKKVLAALFHVAFSYSQLRRV